MASAVSQQPHPIPSSSLLAGQGCLVRAPVSLPEGCLWPCYILPGSRTVEVPWGRSPSQQVAALSQRQPGRARVHTLAPLPVLFPGLPGGLSSCCPHRNSNCPTRDPLLSSVASPLPMMSTGVALHSQPCHKVCFWGKPSQTAASSLKKDHPGWTSERACHGSQGIW